jgi:hypothetical protein
LSAAQDAADNRMYVDVNFSADHRFGLIAQAPGDNLVKKLTYSQTGATNNTIVRINGKDMWLHRTKNSPFKVADPDKLNEVKGEIGLTWTSSWEVTNPRADVVQEVGVRRGDQTGRFDTVVVRYILKNQSKASQRFGLRFMLDTFIGTNDGVPFTIPEQANLCTTQMVARKRQIPDYVQALERPDIKKPGTIAHLGVKVSGHYGYMQPPDMLQITHWPGEDAVWNLGNFNFGDDSAVGLFWDEAVVKPGEARTVGFTYGLANVVSGGSGGKMGLTTGGVFRVDGEFVLTAYLDTSLKRATATLTLPDGLKLSPGPPARQVVAMRANDPYGKCAWRIRCEKAGTFELTVDLGDGLVEKAKVRIREK